MALVVAFVFFIIGLTGNDRYFLDRFLRGLGFAAIGVVIWFVGAWLFMGPHAYDPFAPYGASGWAIE